MEDFKKHIFTLLIGCLLGYLTYPKINIVDSQIIIPEKKGETEIFFVHDTIVEEHVKIVYQGESRVDKVDKKWKDKYDQTKDSLERLNLYYQAIKIKDYEKKILDDDNLSVTVKGKVRGDILSHQTSYIIKSDSTSYLSQRVVEFPRLSGGLGVSLGTPLDINKSTVIKLEGFLQNKKGWQYRVGYDTQKRVWLGINKNFKIIK